VASLLDPRYKTCFFSPVLSETVIGEAKARLAALRAPSATDTRHVYILTLPAQSD